METQLKKMRKYHEITQADMAKKLGVCRQTYSKIEKEPEKATISQVKTICEIFGITNQKKFFTEEL